MPTPENLCDAALCAYYKKEGMFSKEDRDQKDAAFERLSKKGFKPLNISQNLTPEKTNKYVESLSQGHIIDSKTGFGCIIFVSDEKKEIIIAYTGTENLDDLKSDASLAVGKTPKQLSNAMEVYQIVKDLCKSKRYNSYKIFFTGHSLGGTLAMIIGAKTGHKTTTFNAAGVDAKLLETIKNDLNCLIDINGIYPNIQNYAIENDPLYATKDIRYFERIYLGRLLVLEKKKINPIASHNDFETLRKVRNPKDEETSEEAARKRKTIPGDLNKLKTLTFPTVEILDNILDKINCNQNKLLYEMFTPPEPIPAPIKAPETKPKHEYVITLTQNGITTRYSIFE